MERGAPPRMNLDIDISLCGRSRWRSGGSRRRALIRRGRPGDERPRSLGTLHGHSERREDALLKLGNVPRNRRQGLNVDVRSYPGKLARLSFEEVREVVQRRGVGSRRRDCVGFRTEAEWRTYYICPTSAPGSSEISAKPAAGRSAGDAARCSAGDHARCSTSEAAGRPDPRSRRSTRYVAETAARNGQVSDIRSYISDGSGTVYRVAEEVAECWACLRRSFGRGLR